jgi:hypothetical protein
MPKLENPIKMTIIDQPDLAALAVRSLMLGNYLVVLPQRLGNLNAHREYASGRGLTVANDDNAPVLLWQDYQANAFDREVRKDNLKFVKNEFLYVRFMNRAFHQLPPRFESVRKL